MFSGGDYHEVARWLENFVNSHAKREDPRAEAVLDTEGPREGTSYGVRVRLGFGEQAARLQTPHDVFARDETVEAVIGQRCIEFRRVWHVAQKRVVARKLEMGLGVENADQG